MKMRFKLLPIVLETKNVMGGKVISLERASTPGDLHAPSYMPRGKEQRKRGEGHHRRRSGSTARDENAVPQR